MDKVKCDTYYKGAFSIIELLVVVGVIGVITSMIIPAVVKAKEKSKLAHCVSNKRQLIQAWSMYIGDNQDYLPPVSISAGHAINFNTRSGFIDGSINFFDSGMNTNYHMMLHGRYSTAGRYLGNKWRVFKCPEDTYTSEPQRSSGIYYRIRSVAMNDNLGIESNNFFEIEGTKDKLRRNAGNLNTYVLLSQIRHPSNILVFSDSHPTDIANSGFRIAYYGEYRHWAQLPGNYHNKGATINFVDGHVELKRWKGWVGSMYRETKMYDRDIANKWYDHKRSLSIRAGTPDYSDWKWFISRSSKVKVDL